MKTLIAAIILLVLAVATRGFDAVDAWPKTVTLDGVTYYNATTPICVKAGYRLKGVMPTPPSGKQVKGLVTWSQDTNDASRCVAVVEYEDITPPPVVPPYVPEVLVEIPLTNVSFFATTNGIAREWRKKNVPATNAVILAD